MGHKHSFSKKTAWLVKHEQGGVILFIFLLLFFPLIEGNYLIKTPSLRVWVQRNYFFPQICWVLSEYNSFHYMYFPNSVGSKVKKKTKEKDAIFQTIEKQTTQNASFV